MREGISVKLVRDEQSEDDYRDGIIPEPTISQQFLLAIVLWVTKEEFAEDPDDIIAN
jgi:hypothetical protein